MSRLMRFGVGGAVVVASIIIAGWYDGTVMRAAYQQQGITFDIRAELPVLAFGYLLIAGGCLAIGLIGWRLRSVALGIAFVLIGAFFTVLDTLNWKLAAEINGAAPVLPQPIASAISWIYGWQAGLLHAVPILGAAALLIGIVVLVATTPRPSPATKPAPANADPGHPTAVKP